jgi:hypothetical protein
MENLAKNVNPWNIDPTTLTTFAPDSFGPVNTHAFIRVEITNPVDIPPPPGTSLNDRFTFTQLTVTTFIELKNAATPAAAKTVAAESVVQGRGRITVGPYFRQ